MIERFKKPTDKQLVELALVCNEGNVDVDKLTSMLSYCQIVVDRLYDNGDIMVKSQQEIEYESDALDSKA